MSLHDGRKGFGTGKGDLGERLVQGQTAQKLFLGLDEFVLLLNLRRPVTDSTFPPYLFRL
jgi:hypothetical protein